MRPSSSPKWLFALASLVLLIATAGVILYPIWSDTGGGDAAPATDSVKVSQYAADFAVAPDGTMQASEKLSAVFPPGRHGIFRFFDARDPLDPSVRLTPRNFAVTRDGRSEPWAPSWERGRRYYVARVGSAKTTLPAGPHEYDLSYTVRGVLAPTTSGGAQNASGSWGSTDNGSSRLLWNVVAPGWQFAMSSTTSTIHLPGTATSVACLIGDSQAIPCTIEGEGTNTLRVATGELPPRTPVTVRADVALAPPHRDHVPWPIAWDPVLGTSWPLAAAVGVASLLALAIAAAWANRSSEKAPGFPVMYSPPEGLNPAAAYYVMTERDSPTALTALLMQAGEQGLITMQQDEHSYWTVQNVGSDDQWAAADPLFMQLRDDLGIARTGDVVNTADALLVGDRLAQAGAQATVGARRQVRSAGLIKDAPAERLGQLAVVGAAVLAGAMVFFQFGFTALILVPASFAIGGLYLMHSGAGTRRTQTGRRAWSEAGGFYRLLSTPSAQERFDFAARKDLFTTYLPYAVAFGCADRWAAKYRTEVGAEPVYPMWFVPYPTFYGSGGTGFDSSALANFDQSVSSAISSYESAQSAAQSSSNGGGGWSDGGGFSSGSAGGGGGGGSW